MAFPTRKLSNRFIRSVRFWLSLCTLTGLFSSPISAAEISTSRIQQTPHDSITLASGDVISGQFVRAVGNTVTFHNDVLGDLNLKWDEIQTLRTFTKVSVIQRGTQIGRKTPASEIPSGFLTMQNKQIVLTAADQSTVATIAVDDAEYIVDNTTLEKELRGSPGLFSAWNGAITAGASFVRAAQDARNADGAISLVRRVPTVSWLAPRNRTTVVLNGASGKITQPAYTSSGGTFVPALVTKTDLYHFRLQRDQYFSTRAYYFGTIQFDHNFSQNLQLQQLYGAGLGLTAFNTPRQTLDLTANLQYVRQTFIESSPGDDKNLFGSTISANYVARLADGLVFTQYLAYLPAFNQGEAYSIISRNNLTLPAYRNFRVVIGTVNSYLNSVAISEPPSQRNSFQMTFGLSYDIKSSY
jgi:hypothetical protein